jgi:signal transduction histidine kinase
MHEIIHHSRCNGTSSPDSECRILQAHDQGQAVHVDDEVFWRNDGQTFPVEYRSYPILRDGVILGSVVTFSDVTERKEAAEKIRKLNEELEKRVEERTWELQETNNHLVLSMEQLSEAQSQLAQAEKMAALGGLVAGVAHEINTPVGVGVTAVSHLEMKIKSYRERYAAGALTRKDFEEFLKIASESSEMIMTNLKRAADLVRSFKQVAVDQTSGRQRTFKLSAYIDEVLLSLQPKLKNATHTIKVQCPPEVELDSYPGAFSQILTNFILNSLMHGFEESDKGEIEIIVHEKGDGVQLKYTDNGKGIQPAHIKQIFNPFFTTKRSQGGSGLGMHIVYNLVTQTLGGKIECQSSPGQGVCFTVFVPKNSQRLCA